MSFIFDSKEPSSCMYILSIYTPLLCKHHKYAPKKLKEENIFCHPVEPKKQDNFFEADDGELESPPDTYSFSQNSEKTNDESDSRNLKIFTITEKELQALQNEEDEEADAIIEERGENIIIVF